MPRRLILLLSGFLLLAFQRDFHPAFAAEKTYVNSIGMEFVLIPAGSFAMGSDAREDEKPVHSVTISRAFYLGKFEVTQEQWTAVMQGNPSWFRGANLPVEQVFWSDVQEFISRLNRKEGREHYRLPTEAEWEYAAGAGNGGPDPLAGEALGLMAWYDKNSGGATHPVGQKNANAWGLHDMLGNVSEWVQDWYAGDYYRRGSSEDSAGPSFGTLRVRRGGSWSDEAVNCRVAGRAFDAPDSSACGAPGCRLGDLGFRLLLMPE